MTTHAAGAARRTLQLKVRISPQERANLRILSRRWGIPVARVVRALIAREVFESKSRKGKLP